jgi:hypothetical protein
MKKLVLTIFTVVGLALPVCAQSAAAVVDIPFGFVAGNMTMSAGRYEFNSAAAWPIVRLVGADLHTRFLDSHPGDKRSRSELAQLIFHRYGDQYFLSEFRTAHKSREFPVLRLEREAQRTASGAHAQEIVLAMR